MRLQLKHFGRIREADLDIRPLTVFVGENGTNKSWAAYALHGLLRTMSRQAGSVHIGVEAENPELDSVIADLTGDEGVTGQGMTLRSIRIGHDAVLERGLTQAGLAQMLALESAMLDIGATAQLDYNLDDLPDHVVDLRLESNPKLKLLAATATMVTGNTFAWRAVDWDSPAQLAGLIKQFATTALDRVLLLPAERKAFTGLAGFDRALDALRSGRQGAIPLAWVDFADMLREAMGASAQVSSLADVAKQFAVLTGGSLQADRNTLNFQVKDGPTLPMHGAASLVRAVAGLDLYLSRLARKGDVVIIDELEMNAHPSAQLALVELVAMIVQAGVRVVFTTHSPYIVDHLNNLMAAASVPAAAQPGLAEQFALKSTQAFIAPEMVAAYRFQGQSDGSVAVLDVLNRDRARISWTTFTEVSDRLSALWDSVDEAKSKPAPEAKAGAKPGKSKPARAA